MSSQFGRVRTVNPKSIFGRYFHKIGSKLRPQKFYNQVQFDLTKQTANISNGINGQTFNTHIKVPGSLRIRLPQRDLEFHMRIMPSERDGASLGEAIKQMIERNPLLENWINEQKAIGYTTIHFSFHQDTNH